MYMSHLEPIVLSTEAPGRTTMDALAAAINLMAKLYIECRD
jgi:hypothetical protein